MIINIIIVIFLNSINDSVANKNPDWLDIGNKSAVKMAHFRLISKTTSQLGMHA